MTRRLFLSAISLACLLPRRILRGGEKAPANPQEPRTVYYIHATQGDDVNGDGTIERPFQTLWKALEGPRSGGAVFAMPSRPGVPVTIGGRFDCIKFTA